MIKMVGCTASYCIVLRYEFFPCREKAKVPRDWLWFGFDPGFVAYGIPLLIKVERMDERLDLGLIDGSEVG